MIPQRPDVPDAQRATGELRLRYEDVAQDGRMMVTALSHALGEIVWRRLLEQHEGSRALREQGVVPILTRLSFVGGGGPLGLRAPLEVEGSFELAHAPGPSGEAERIFVNMWIEATGIVGRVHGPPPEREGEPVHAGRMFAEHVFTRLFAAPEERKVTRLDGHGLPGVPPKVHAWQRPATLASLPEGATPLGELRAEKDSVVFGLAHTDSNLHVNSLVYPRLFEDAALRCFSAMGERCDVLVRELDVAYRKPCFAGERVRIVLAPFRLGAKLGAYGAFVDDATIEPGAALASLLPRAHAYVCAVFEP